MYTHEELQVITDKLNFLVLDEEHMNAYDVFAPCILGEYYTNKKKDPNKALEYYLQCIESYRNNTEPYADELKESVKSTYYNACFSAGMIYYQHDNIADPTLSYGEQRIVNAAPKEDADIEKAKTYLREAADDGKDLDACCYLGSLMITKGEPEGIEYIQRAAKNGHMYAQNTLGRCYEFGLFVEQSTKKALRWYRRAADQGDMVARENLCRHRW